MPDFEMSDFAVIKSNLKITKFQIQKFVIKQY